jgi:hypothetical protein
MCANDAVGMLAEGGANANPTVSCRHATSATRRDRRRQNMRRCIAGSAGSVKLIGTRKRRALSEFLTQRLKSRISAQRIEVGVVVQPLPVSESVLNRLAKVS